MLGARWLFLERWPRDLHAGSARLTTHHSRRPSGLTSLPPGLAPSVGLVQRGLSDTGHRGAADAHLGTGQTPDQPHCQQAGGEKRRPWTLTPGTLLQASQLTRRCRERCGCRTSLEAERPSWHSASAPGFGKGRTAGWPRVQLSYPWN